MKFFVQHIIFLFLLSALTGCRSGEPHISYAGIEKTPNVRKEYPVDFKGFYILTSKKILNKKEIYQKIKIQISKKEDNGCYNYDVFESHNTELRDMCLKSVRYYSTTIDGKKVKFARFYKTLNKNKINFFIFSAEKEKKPDVKKNIKIANLYIKGKTDIFGFHNTEVIAKYDIQDSHIVRLSLYKSCKGDYKNNFASNCINNRFVSSDYIVATSAVGNFDEKYKENTWYYHKLKSINYLPLLFKHGEILEYIYIVKYSKLKIPSIPDPKPLVFTSLDKLDGLVKSVQKKADDTVTNIKNRVENAERNINQKIDDTGDRIGKQVDKISPF